jgi:hypothetical protein
MARYNTSLANATIGGTTTIASPIQGAFTAFTGTAPYTVTLPAPSAFPGSNQTFYNATNGTVTLTTPAGIFTGTGGSGLTTTSVFTGNVVSVTSDGTNYVVISEDGSILTATTGSFSSNVDINGTLTVQSSGSVNFIPSIQGTINNVAIGSSTRASGAFTTLAANNSVSFTANTASSTTTTGTLIVTGGIGVSGQVTANTLTGTLQTAAQPNITSTGTLTTTGLTVNGRQYFNGSASFYSLGSFNTGSAQWVLLGRFTGGTTGETLNLQFYGANGYNGSFGQHSRTFIQIRNGNGNPVDTNVSVDYHTEGQSSMILDVRVQNVNPVPVAYGAAWDVYVQINGVCGNAYYIPFINSAASWSHTGTAGVAAPTVSSTVISGTNLFMMNSTSWFGGNIGLATTTPTFATIDGYAQKGIEIVGTKENGTAPVIRLRETGSGKGAFEIRSNRQGVTSGNYLAFGEDTSTFMVIRGDDDGGGTGTRGYVGINTTSPETKLNIFHGAGSAAGDGVIRIGGTGNYPSLELGIKGAYDGMITTYGNDMHLYAGHWRTTATASENHTMFFYTSQAGSSNWSTPKMTLSNVGNLTITGTLTESSSITLKENIEPITGALASILKLDGKIYDRIDNKEKGEAGLIAEQVFKVLPNLVHVDDDGKPVGVKYTKTVAYLVESIKELYEEIKQLKGK